jgi:hypothetical protein
LFLRRLTIERVGPDGQAHLCPIQHLDSFAMRNFTNDAIFDDTLPIGEGLLEAGNRVPLELLREKMEGWFRRKSYLLPSEHLRVTEQQVL